LANHVNLPACVKTDGDFEPPLLLTVETEYPVFEDQHARFNPFNWRDPFVAHVTFEIGM